MASTGAKFPTANSEDYAQWGNPNNVHADDGAFADESTQGQQNDFYNFDFGVPAGATIDGISVEVEYTDSSGVTAMGVELSWDSGPSYTTTGYAGGDPVTGVWTKYTLGGATDTWGRTWSASEFSDANFRLRVTGTTIPGGSSIRLDYVTVNVFYTEAATGVEGVIKATGVVVTPSA